jgi:hypothetical protein
MKYTLVLLTLVVSGCAVSGSGTAEPCVKQDKCVMFCKADQNKCEVREKADGA